MGYFKAGKKYFSRIAVSVIACFVSVTALSVFAAAYVSGASVYRSFVDNRTYKGNWSYPDERYIVALDSGYMTFEKSSSGYIARYYDSSFKFKEEKKISTELAKFGGFYSDSNGYYILSGQNNDSESSTVECYRLTKYDKSWNRSGSCGLKDCNTYQPFYGGSADITSSGNYLVIRTCHTMYKSSDGYNHQANVTILVNTSTMKILDSKYSVTAESTGYCSHSFNEYVRIDSNRIIGADHGDAYPRVMGIWSYKTDITTGKIGTSTTVYKPFVIGGSYDANGNKTGATLGGLEVSSSSYIIVGSSIDQSDYSTTGKNIFVSTVNKSSGSTSTKWLTTDADSTSTSYSNPFIVKISSTSFAVIWSRDDKVYYAFIDGSGTIQGKVKSVEGQLSDCQPILAGNKIVWFTNSSTTNFYYINTSDQSFHLSRNYSITVAKPTNGTATPSKTTAYAGENITIDVAPNNGYELDQIEVNGTPIEGTEFTMGESDAAVTVTFKKIMYNVTINKPDNGTASLTAEQAGINERITVSYTPNAGYQLDSIKVNGEPITGSYFYMGASDADVEVTFKKRIYKVSLYSVNYGSAELSASSASIGDEITVNITPDEGYELDYINVYNKKIYDNKFTMEAGNATVYVYLKKIKYPVTVTYSEGGTATVNKQTASMNESVLITYTASKGYKLDYIKLNGTVITKTQFTMGAGEAKVEVAFKKIVYTVTLASTTNGSATLSAYSASVGDTITVNVTPDEGYELNTIKVDGTAIPGTSFEMGAGNTTVVVTFREIQYPITVTYSEGGIAKASKATAAIGDIITIYPTPSEGYEIKSIVVNGKARTTRQFTMEAGEAKVEVTFKKIVYTVSLERMTNGDATLSAYAASIGDKIEVNAIPDEGYELDTIKVYGNTITGTSFDMRASDTKVTVTFRKIKYTIKVNATTNGSATVSPTSASIGDKVTVNVNPDEDYELDTIKVNGEAITGNTFTMKAGNTTVDVSFKKKPVYTIKVTKVSEGSVSLSKNPAYIGDKITVTATPAEGYELDSIKVNGKVLEGTEFTLTDQDTTVVVTFTNEHKLTKILGKAATCTEDGYKDCYECSRCHKKFSDAQGQNEITQAEKIAKLGHDLGLVKAKPETYDDDGNIEHYACKREGCGKLFSDADGQHEITKADTIIPRKGAPGLGETVEKDGLKYEVTNPSTDGTGTFKLIGAKDPVGSLVIPSAVVLNGSSYKVNRIGTDAFRGDQTLTYVYIGANILRIDANAFYDCSNLATVSGGANLRTIGSCAFARCPKLKTFVITSKALYMIGPKAFYADSRLKTVYIKKTTKLTKSGVKNSLKGSKVKTVKVRKSKIRKYKKIFKKSNSGRKVKVKK